MCALQHLLLNLLQPLWSYQVQVTCICINNYLFLLVHVKKRKTLLSVGDNVQPKMAKCCHVLTWGRMVTRNKLKVLGGWHVWEISQKQVKYNLKEINGKTVAIGIKLVNL